MKTIQRPIMDPATVRHEPRNPKRLLRFSSATVMTAAPVPAHAMVAFSSLPAVPDEYGSATMPFLFFEYSTATASVNQPMIASRRAGPEPLAPRIITDAAPPAAIADPPANANGSPWRPPWPTGTPAC